MKLKVYSINILCTLMFLFLLFVLKLWIAFEQTSEKSELIIFEQVSLYGCTLTSSRISLMYSNIYIFSIILRMPYISSGDWLIKKFYSKFSSIWIFGCSMFLRKVAKQSFFEMIDLTIKVQIIFYDILVYTLS